MGEELENFSKQLEIVKTYQLSNKLAYILGILVDKLSLDIRTAIGLMSSCIDMLKQVELDPDLELRVLYLLYEGNFGKAREVLREHTTHQQRLDQINRDRAPTGNFDARKEPSLPVYQPQNLSFQTSRQRPLTNYGQDRESEPLQSSKEQTHQSYFINPDTTKPNTASIPSFSDSSQYRPATLAPNLPNPNTTSTPSFQDYSQYRTSHLAQDKPNASTTSASSIDDYSRNLPSALSSEPSNYKPLIQDYKPPQPSLSTSQYLQNARQPYSSLSHVDPPPGVAIRPISTFPTPQGPLNLPIQNQLGSSSSSNPQSSTDLKNQGRNGSEASNERDIPLYESIVVLPKDSRTGSSYGDMNLEKTNKVEENMPKVDFMANASLPEMGYKEQDRFERKEDFKNTPYNPVIKLPSQDNPPRNIALNPLAPYDPKMNSERNPESSKDFNLRPAYQLPEGALGRSQETVPQVSNLYQTPSSNYSQSIPISSYNPQSNPYSNNPIYPSQPPINLPLQFNPASLIQPVHFPPPNIGYNPSHPPSASQSSQYQSSVPYRGYEATPGSDKSAPINTAIVGQTAKPPSQDIKITLATTTSNKPPDEIYNSICKLCNLSLHAKAEIKLRCGHSIHRDCLKSNVKSPYNNTATCPIGTCQTVIDESICRSIFESSETSSTSYQPTQNCPKCKAAVSSFPSSGVINCSTCKSLTCLKCKGSHSPGTNCTSSINIIEGLRK